MKMEDVREGMRVDQRDVRDPKFVYTGTVVRFCTTTGCVTVRFHYEVELHILVTMIEPSP